MKALSRAAFQASVKARRHGFRERRRTGVESRDENSRRSGALPDIALLSRRELPTRVQMDMVDRKDVPHCRM